MSDPTLFDPEKSYRTTDPDTSKAAAYQATAFANSQAGKILHCFKGGSELTQSEVAHYVDLHRHQVNKRLADLHRKGLIELTGDQRLGSAGRNERVWRLA